MSCQNEEKLTRILYTCSGCCTEGAVSDKVGRKLREVGYARCGSSCLAGIGAGYPRFLKAAAEASEVIAIDGCKMVCAKMLLKKANIAATSFVLVDMGFSEDQDQEAFITNVCQRIMANVRKVASEETQ